MKTMKPTAASMEVGPPPHGATAAERYVPASAINFDLPLPLVEPRSLVVGGVPLEHRAFVEAIKAQGKRTELVRVSPESIERLMAMPPPPPLLPPLPDDTFDGAPPGSEAFFDMIRECRADARECIMMARAQRENLIEQYKRKGVAYIEVFVDKDMADLFTDVEELFTDVED